MLERLKAGLALISGWVLAAALAFFWLFTRSRRSVPGYSKVEAKSVPESDADVLKEAKKEGLIR